MLKPFGIAPEVIRLPGGGTPRGYLRSQFEDAWERYLSAGNSHFQSATVQQMRWMLNKSMVSKVQHEGQCCTSKKCKKPNNDGDLLRCCTLKVRVSRKKRV